MTLVLVTGSSGFIGHHLVQRLAAEGKRVRAVDLHEPHYGLPAGVSFLAGDLRVPEFAAEAVDGAEEVYALAADMGGMGYIATHGAGILHNNLLIDANTVGAAGRAGVKRLFYASSACVYPREKQSSAETTGLREEDAIPAEPDDAYGWEKLLAEKLCSEYAAAGRLETRIARFHNIFGPFGAWTGGREKAPAALARKIAEARLSGSGEIEIWGDGEQTRSFCYVDDCIDGIRALMDSNVTVPVNLGQERSVTINELAGMIARIAGVDIRIRHVAGPQGVRGRNSDSSLAKRLLGWEPRVSLEEGLAITYRWVEEQVRRS